jgi:hypothetical protein
LAGASGDLVDFLPLRINNFRGQLRKLPFHDIRDYLESLLEAGFTRFGHWSLPLQDEAISKMRIKQGFSREASQGE